MVGNSAFLIRVATALADRAPNSISVRRSQNWVNVWLVAAASRASFSNSRPIVGRRQLPELVPGLKREPNPIVWREPPGT